VRTFGWITRGRLSFSGAGSTDHPPHSTLNSQSTRDQHQFAAPTPSAVVHSNQPVLSRANFPGRVCMSLSLLFWITASCYACSRCPGRNVSRCLGCLERWAVQLALWPPLAHHLHRVAKLSMNMAAPPSTLSSSACDIVYLELTAKGYVLRFRDGLSRPHSSAIY
jgi:hypothetical protein